ncbi:hypothetical protein ACJJTC_014101 [Scirpophaga incertulas]
MSIDLDKPRYDQSTYMGRAQHFLKLTNPLNVFASDKQLDEAKKIVTEFRLDSLSYAHNKPQSRTMGTKYLYDSAFHPDTGENNDTPLDACSAQAPMNTIITGCMITFYKTTSATVFWQWMNQTFNAVVNYTNRSGDAPLPNSQLLASYCAACGGALGTALFLNSKVKKMKNPTLGRFVPFAAVCGANFINIPMMRSGELLNGTPVLTADGQRVGESKTAARTGIALVCVSRVLMALPGMTLTPMATAYATRVGLFRGRQWAAVPFQLFLVGLCVTFATPLCCAIFDQRASLSVGSLEPELQAFMKKNYPKETHVYFNKGL